MCDYDRVLKQIGDKLTTAHVGRKLVDVTRELDASGKTYRCLSDFEENVITADFNLLRYNINYNKEGVVTSVTLG